jgi:hypothetical protein
MIYDLSLSRFDDEISNSYLSLSIQICALSVRRKHAFYYLLASFLRRATLKILEFRILLLYFIG